MAIEFIKEKPLSEVAEEESLEKIENQADVFEVVANLYEEVEELRSRIKALEGGGK